MGSTFNKNHEETKLRTILKSMGNVFFLLCLVSEG